MTRLDQKPNRAAALSLLIALAWAAPLAARAQSDAAAVPQAAASAAEEAEASVADAVISAALPAPDPSVDDQTFEQWASAERKRIADGRAAANARYDQDRRDCWQRFAVNACLDKARERRRAVTDALRHDELVINAQERERRTAARLDEIARKQPEKAQRDGAGDATPAATPATSASEAAR